jgi:hypothetical protein
MQIHLGVALALAVIGGAAGALALAVIGGAAGLDSPSANGPAGFDPPELILDGSEIDRQLFPTFADLDGDGATDLLVGTPDRLLVRRNLGTEARPAYAEPAWLDETVPSARIPGG